MKIYILCLCALTFTLTTTNAQNGKHKDTVNSEDGTKAAKVGKRSVKPLKIFDSPNTQTFVDNLPFVADYPIAREIRYTYGSVLELKRKEFDPYIVTNEDSDYFEVSEQGISGQVLNSQYQAFRDQGRSWIDKNADKWSASELRGYTSFQNKMENTMSAVHSYYAIMGALASLGNALIKKEAQSLTDWAASVTRCIGSEAPEGSILHLNMIRLTKGERFKFHSSNDFIVTVTLERGDGTILVNTQVMQLWRNTKKRIVAPESAIPYFERTISEEKLNLISKPLVQNNFTHRFALLINTGIKELYTSLTEERDR